ncbi:hypothetical protein AHAS_Ahas14G0028900 [Arachis hypogaea]|uniref:RNase H type-1 domain-containing protein n=1 Tax=Arachis hypogaea TaxID=3818 RepID=A0A444ZC26_ARAHY|nr:hypothetical protein Ahy_B04g069158 [Arachis hypogaea]
MPSFGRLLKAFRLLIHIISNTLLLNLILGLSIKFIKDGCPASHLCKPLLEDITILERRFQKVEWIHILREANVVADTLAKKGQELPIGLHLFKRSPSDTCSTF